MKPLTFHFLLMSLVLIALFAFSCTSPNAKTEGLDTESVVTSVSDPGGWTVPNSLLPGYTVFPKTYDIWANSFNYWMNQELASHDLPTEVLPLQADLATTDITDTGYESTDGLKIYFALRSANIMSLKSDPTLILVSYKVKTVMAENGEDTLAIYLNDAPSYGYWEVRKDVDSGVWSFNSIDSTDARTMVQNWKSVINNSLYGFGPVYSYAFEKEEVNAVVEQCTSSDPVSPFTLRFGLHAVSPNNPAYWFGDKDTDSDVAFPVQGYLVPVIIMTDSIEGNNNKMLLDYSSPCPKRCGQTDLWREDNI